MFKQQATIVRDNKLLEDYMYDLWDDHFADVPRPNLVLIHFGRHSRRQLGCIRWASSRSKVKALLKEKHEELEVQDHKKVSIITMTRYFMYDLIPDNVVKMTIAHEMVHYAHGFNSPLPQLFKDPHRGNIVNKELIMRGLEEELNEAESWIHENWVRTLRSLA